MEKAKDIWKNKLREARKPLFTELDLAFMKAIERNQDTTEIAQKKQALRDVTDHPDIEAATTTEELKAVWPEVLEEPK
jgi:hypothetical protein